MVARGDPGLITVEELTGYAIILGPAGADEKHGAAVALRKDLGGAGPGQARDVRRPQRRGHEGPGPAQAGEDSIAGHSQLRPTPPGGVREAQEGGRAGGRAEGPGPVRGRLRDRQPVGRRPGRGPVGPAGGREVGRSRGRPATAGGRSARWWPGGSRGSPLTSARPAPCGRQPDPPRAGAWIFSSSRNPPSGDVRHTFNPYCLPVSPTENPHASVVSTGRGPGRRPPVRVRGHGRGPGPGRRPRRAEAGHACLPGRCGRPRQGGRGGEGPGGGHHIQGGPEGAEDVVQDRRREGRGGGRRRQGADPVPGRVPGRGPAGRRRPDPPRPSAGRPSGRSAGRSAARSA